MIENQDYSLSNEKWSHKISLDRSMKRIEQEQEEPLNIGDPVTRLRDGIHGIITDINSCEYIVTTQFGDDYIPIDSFEDEYEY